MKNLAITEFLRKFFTFAVVLFWTCTVSATTITYNLTTDWKNNSNPNGVWQYDQSSTPLPYQSNLGSGSCFGSHSGITGGYAEGINFGSGNCLPAFFKTTGNATNTNDWVKGDVIIHSQDPTNGSGKGQATLLWIAPTGGTITFSGDVWYAHSDVQRSNDFTLSLDSTTLASGVVAYNSIVGNSRLNPDAFSSSGSLNVNAGDEVSLVLVRSPGQTFGSLDGVELAITETTSKVITPEPTTYLLFGIGCIGLAGIRRYRSSVN